MKQKFKNIFLALLLFSAWAHAQTIPSTGSFPIGTFPTTTEALIRNGLNAYEASLITPSSPSPGTTLNPTGSPIWNTGGNAYGDFFNFKVTYNSCTGTVNDSIDFNRNGSYSSSEGISSTSTSLVNNGMKYVQVLMEGNGSTSNVLVNNLTINGTNFGSLATTASIATIVRLYEDASGLFGDIEVSGTFTFTANSGAQAIPKLLISFGENHTSNNLNITACDSYTWALNNTTYTMSTTQSVMVGCIPTNLKLTIIPSSTDVTTLSECDSYQWNGNNYTATGIYTGATTDCVTEILDLTITSSSNNITTYTSCGSYDWGGQTYNASGIYTGATTNCVTQILDLTVTPIPTQPSLACYETASFNTTSCAWDVTGTQPAQPSLACYETASFNTTSCAWDVTGTQPAQPTLACYETASFNTTSCAWDVTGTQPAQPTLACYETASFNTTSCAWDVTGTQPAQPTLACYETASFNTTSCAWDVTGTQPAQPTLACYETASFNTTSCAWDVTGTQPAQPTLACYETASFNTTSCAWDVTGTQPAQPTLACYETASFNTTSCAWDVTGTQPAQPTLACYETASFNTTSCAWDVTGTQPAQPTLACFETASFNTTSCAWDVTGTQPTQPSLACYETASFNTTSCAWDVTGTQPAQPSLACYETASFNTTSCAWDVTGTQPAQPSLACYETASFNTTSCAWDVTGTQPAQPTLACYETASFNTTSCAWDVTGTQPAQPTLACYETASFNTTSCAWDVTGTQPAQPTLACYETASFNTTSCAWDVTGTQPAQPTLACYETASFNTTSCAWDVTGTQPAQPTLACYETASFNTTSCAWDVTGSPNPPNVITQSACVSYSWEGNTYTQSGVYTGSTIACITQVLDLTINQNPIVSASNVLLCTPSSSVSLIGTPAGGTFSQANPYVGPATTYTYTYTDANGCTATSSPATINIASVAPATIDPVITVGTNTATISWTLVPGNTVYYLWYRPVGTNVWLTPTYGQNTSTANLVALLPGTLYEYKVRNNNTPCGLFGPFGELKNFTTLNIPCGSPTSIISAVEVPIKKALISWNALPDVAQYSVWYKKVGDVTWSTGLFAGNVTSFTTGTLANGTYDVKIRNRCNGLANFTPFGSITHFTIGASSKEVNQLISAESSYQIFPNPTNGVVNIEFTSLEKNNMKVKIFDLTGRLMKEIQINSEIGLNNVSINLDDLSSGLYAIQIFQNDKLSFVTRIRKSE